MVLIGLHGNVDDVNTQLMFKALEQEPTLVIDCTNGTDIGHYADMIDNGSLHNTYVVEVNLLYKLRDTISSIPAMARRVGVSTVILTTFDRLAQGAPSSDRKAVMEHAWVMLSKLSTQFTVVVGVDSQEIENAKKYCHKIMHAPIRV